MPISLHIWITITMSTMILIVMFILKTKFKISSNSTSNVECGFNSLNQKKFKFPNQFFMIAILFVIFDMELVAILPIPLINLNKSIFLMLLSIMIILAISILMEWLNGLIEWIKS